MKKTNKLRKFEKIKLLFLIPFIFLFVLIIQSPTKTTISAETQESNETNTTQNNPPILIREIENITLRYSEEKMINLSQYFYDPDNETLVYTAVSSQNISINIVGDLAFIRAINDFVGLGYARFLASDLKNMTFSNEFLINITDEQNISENTPPNCSITNITLVKLNNLTIDFNQFCNDYENDSLSYNLSANINFVQNNSLFTFIPNILGTLNATLIVSDSKNYSAYGFYIFVKDFWFNISTNKQQYIPGEETYISINAPNGSIVNLTLITPSQNKEQEVINTFPITYIYYNSEEGNYLIKAIINYYYVTQIKELNFSIKSPSNLTASIDSVSEARTIDTITLKAVVSGNYGSVFYEWDLNNDNITDSNSQNTTYNFRNPGTVNVRLKVKDSYKEVVVYKQIRILGLYDITIAVKDENNNPINAVIKFNNETKNAQNGNATFKDVLEGEHKVQISKEGYYDYESFIVVNSNKTVEIQLQKIREKPKINIIEPNDDYTFNKKNISITFSVSSDNKLNCVLYLKSIGDWWIEKGNLKNISPNTQTSFELNLEEGNYTYKIECSDGFMSSATSELKFKIQPSEFQLLTTSESVILFDDTIEEIENSISNIYSLNTEILETITELNIIKELENYKKEVERARRDYFDLRERDLSQKEFENQSLSLINKVSEIRNKIIKSVSIKEAETFIKYPTEEDIYNITLFYYKILNPKLKFSEYKKLNEQAQKLATTTTRVERIIIERKNSSEEFYLIRKIISPSGNINDLSLIQVIPKNIVDDASKIRFISKQKILQKDPIIEFKISELEANTASYIINIQDSGNKNLKDFQEIKDIFVINRINYEVSKTTGLAIIDFNNLNIKNADTMSLRIFLIILLLLIFLFLSLEINPILLIKKGRNVEKQIIILLEQAKELMQHGKYDEAASIYYEIKILYNLLSFKQKEALYDDIKNFYDSLNAAYLEQLLEESQTSLSENKIQDAKKFFEYADYVYKLLPQEFKEVFSKKYENLKNSLEQK
ncbi:MAG: PEGA domain-containing protein [Candidatus Woesearchaeota archaeon]